MELIWEYIITMIWSILEFLSCFIFDHAFFPSKLNTNQKTISLFIMATVMCVYSCLELGSFLKYTLTICLATGWSIIACRGRWLQFLLVVIVSYFFSGIVDIAVSYGVCAVLGITFNELVWKKLTYIFVVTCAKLLAILVAYLVLRLRTPAGWQPMRGKWLLLTVLFPTVSMAMILLAFESNQERNDITAGVFLICCVLAIANIAILYIINIMERSSKKEMEIIMLNQQMELQTKNIVSLEKSYRAQRQATHDYRNQLQTISDLLISNQTELVKEYIQQLQEAQTTHTLCVNSRHPIVDAILNQKYQLAAESSIEMHIQVTDLSQIRMETNALVVLLSNLLDNAIEACQKLPTERIINCKILANEDIFLSISNTSKPVCIVDNLIETSKFPKQDHGYGLVTVQHILQQINAEFTLEYKDGWFQFVAEIPIKDT